MPVPVRMPCRVVMREVGFKYWVSDGVPTCPDGHCLKTWVFSSPRRSRSFKTVSILIRFCDASTHYACFAVKLKDIAISLRKSTVPIRTSRGVLAADERRHLPTHGF